MRLGESAYAIICLCSSLTNRRSRRSTASVSGRTGLPHSGCGWEISGCTMTSSTDDPVVLVKAIGIKVRERVLIGGEAIDLS